MHVGGVVAFFFEEEFDAGLDYRGIQERAIGGEADDSVCGMTSCNLVVSVQYVVFATKKDRDIQLAADCLQFFIFRPCGRGENQSVCMADALGPF